jgi:hypothetical protein
MESDSKEVHMMEAAVAFQSGLFDSVSTATWKSDVPYKTLNHRVNGLGTRIVSNVIHSSKLCLHMKKMNLYVGLHSLLYQAILHVIQLSG